MKSSSSIRLNMAAVAVAACLTGAPAVFAATAVPGVNVGKTDLGGVVSGPNGPEAGVWVIAETTDLPTKFTKIVVTDDQGRYLIPELPKAKYTVWVRGYGLVDSAKVKATPGQTLKLKAKVAPNERAAAHYYPGMYWYSMITLPASNEFPGTGEKGNGIPPFMKTQGHWIDLMKNSCQSCHALGSERIRTAPKNEFGHMESSMQAWARRIQSGQALTGMALGIARLGPERGLNMYADWTDRIAKGEVPTDKPKRPQGVERNVVYSMWDWSVPQYYLHDAISTDKRNPTINANGRIYGSPEESTDLVPWLDPVSHKVGTIKMPYIDPKNASSTELPMAKSKFWGDKPIWDGHTSIHNDIMDDQGRVWFSAKMGLGPNPEFCKKGSSHPSAQVVPLDGSARHLSMYDPKTQKWSLIRTCFGTHHLYFAKDANNTLWTSAGPPQSGVVGWLNTKMYLETGDAEKSQGWTPLIIDTNGNGKRDEYVEANQPLDAAKDKRVMAAFYGVQPSPVDDSIWGQSMDSGFTRIDQPGYIIRLAPGSDPSRTSLAEIYQAPDGAYGSRGLDLTSTGIVWTVLSSGHFASFDRSKCKVLNGPTTAEGKHCPEGWTLYPFEGPKMKGANIPAEHAYYVWVDRDNTLGLGKDVPIASTNGGESLTALVDGKQVTLRVPYPLGFFTKNVDGRIDDAKAGWKGRGVWTTFGSRTVFHNEGGSKNYPKAYKVQIRPDPLAN